MEGLAKTVAAKNAWGRSHLPTVAYWSAIDTVNQCCAANVLVVCDVDGFDGVVGHGASIERKRRRLQIYHRPRILAGLMTQAGVRRPADVELCVKTRLGSAEVQTNVLANISLPESPS
jgi:hypothetical protein